MVDLSQNQPQKQEPTSNAPASDKPPVTQPDEPSVIPTPGEPNKPPDDISTPPIKDIKDEEKIDSPEQEEIKKELSELGIPPQGGSKKTRVILAALGVFFLVATLPAAVYLVKQRQEIRRQAGYPCNSNSDCNVGEECVGGQCVVVTPSPSPSVQPSPSVAPGFCGGCGKSDGYVSGLPGPSDCNGTWCHTSQRNYCCWDEDGNGTCDICATGQTENVTCSGNCINFKNMQGQSVKFCTFYANHDVTCPYSTGSLNCSTTTIPSNNWSKCISSGKCGQLEADGYCGVCKATGCGGPPPSEPPEESPPPSSPPPSSPSPPPSLPPDTALCEFCWMFDQDWERITDFSTLSVGQTVYLATRGATSNPKGITKARFRINGGDWIETTSKHGNKFYIQYIILEANTYTVQSMVYNPDLGWY